MCLDFARCRRAQCFCLDRCAHGQLLVRKLKCTLYDAHMKKLYPPIEPFDSGKLKVSAIHELYYEQCGNPNGQPAVFLHGGPGGGLIPDYRRFFDPNTYRVVLFDQRGSGQSTPHANLEDNTTWDLVA